MGTTTDKNKEARTQIALICESKNWTRCWLKFSGKCMGEAHAPAHRHNRNAYKGKPEELLWAIEQWVPACNACHYILDFRKTKAEKEQIFLELRGEEPMFLLSQYKGIFTRK